MAIVVWDNGEGYSDKAIYFFEVEDCGEAVIKLLEMIGFAGYVALICDKVTWREGSPANWAEHISYFFCRTLSPPAEIFIHLARNPKLAANLRNVMHVRHHERFDANLRVAMLTIERDSIKSSNSAPLLDITGEDPE